MPSPVIAYRPFERSDIAAATDVWNMACGESLCITHDLFEYNTRPTPGVAQMGRVAVLDGKTVGTVLASVAQRRGWVDVIAIAPQAQRQGIGAGLLDWACGWLREQGCEEVRLGSSLRPFVPGLPAELMTLAFFIKQGWTHNGEEWDLACNLAEQRYALPDDADYRCRPAEPGDLTDFHDFLGRNFPGRWHWEFNEFLREEGRLTDYMLLHAQGRVHGFCRVTLADSERPIDRYYMHDLPKPWGQLGTVGVSEEMRGRGFGRAVVVAALQRLQTLGVRGCVIDWTDLLDFYAKFGFKPLRQYHMLSKNVAGR
jgi:predicted N-acetyltransferase YhbS